MQCSDSGGWGEKKPTDDESTTVLTDAFYELWLVTFANQVITVVLVHTTCKYFKEELLSSSSRLYFIGCYPLYDFNTVFNMPLLTFPYDSEVSIMDSG